MDRDLVEVKIGEIGNVAADQTAEEKRLLLIEVRRIVQEEIRSYDRDLPSRLVDIMEKRG